MNSQKRAITAAANLINALVVINLEELDQEFNEQLERELQEWTTGEDSDLLPLLRETIKRFNAIQDK